MQHHLSEIVVLLNRIHRLHEYAAKFCKPYRASKIRICFEDALAIVEIHTIHSGNYKNLLDRDSVLDRATELKENAVERNDYEHAAYYRDIENARLKYLLSRQAVNANDKYFIREGRIYEKAFVTL